ncbi:hypothetical protein PHAVU_008G153400 [Phaseolus vulgaris]|uniref:protein POLYCHOME-like isoform X2 n=1 Tax=Phaseolus vulgaris TaxID=3885 RepID=UPI0035CC532A
MSASSQSGFKNQIMFSSLSPSSVFRELFPSPPKSVGVKVREVTPAGGKVPKIVFDFSNLPEGESDRRKKLLNSIDKVEEQVLQQLEILKNTASAKEAERANRVRILMSMRFTEQVVDEKLGSESYG